jgi:glycosyltransferase involved in cell wall biosynthesis
MGDCVTHRPRIVVIDHVADLSGGQLAILRLATALGDRADFRFILGADGPLVDELTARGHDVEVIALGAMQSERIADIRPATYLLKYGRVLFGLVPRLAAALDDFGADVVYTNSLKAHVYGGLSARSAGRPWVAHVRDVLAPPYLSRALRASIGLFLTLLRPDALIANSQATASAIPAPYRSHVIPSGIDRAPAIATIPNDPLTLGLLGRLVEWKGQNVAIEALALIRNSIPGARLLIGGHAAQGTDAYLQRLRALMASHQLEDAVEFTGFEADPYRFFARCHIAVHTSLLPEPFGQVIVEALAVGRPVIATQMGGPVEILGGRSCGRLVPAGDPAALASAVRAMVADRALVHSIPGAAIDRARDYTLAASADASWTLLSRLAAGPPRRRLRRRTRSSPVRATGDLQRNLS